MNKIEDEPEAPRSPVPMHQEVRRLTSNEIVKLLKVEDFWEVEPWQNLWVFLPINTLI